MVELKRWDLIYSRDGSAMTISLVLGSHYCAVSLKIDDSGVTRGRDGRDMQGHMVGHEALAPSHLIRWHCRKQLTIIKLSYCHHLLT